MQLCCMFYVISRTKQIILKFQRVFLINFCIKALALTHQLSSVPVHSHSNPTTTMATIPSTIVVCTDDKVALPLNAVYGVKDIAIKGDKVFVSLSYSPKAETLERKFGNLPVRYIRTKIETEDDLKILEKALKRYKFNLHEDAVEAIEDGSSSSSNSKGKKKKLCIRDVPQSPPTEEPLIVYSSDDENENIPPPPPPILKKSKKDARPSTKNIVEKELSDILSQPFF